MGKRDGITKLNKRIAERNRRFARLSDAAKRVAIATDVLKQLAAKRIKAVSGYYFIPPDSVKISIRDENKDLAVVLPAVKKCEACALGSMFMCAVEQADNLRVGEVLKFVSGEKSAPLSRGSFNTHGYLSQFFTPTQLGLIEHTFEQTTYSWNPEASDRYARLPGLDERTRLRLIMENIVRNRGTFNVRDRKMLSVAKP